MKTLVIQLARIGDIYQSRSAIETLVRAQSEVHCVARSRFIDALECIEGIHSVHPFDTAHFLGPIAMASFKESTATCVQASVQSVQNWVDHLAAEQFEAIVNLSFSPMSSWLTYALTERASQIGKRPVVVGYTRTADGYLAIPDDVSAYFYAQVGGLEIRFRDNWGAAGLHEMRPPNRLSLSSIFVSAVEQLGFQSQPWTEVGPASFIESSGQQKARQIAIHIGASRLDRTLSPSQFADYIDRLMESSAAATHLKVVLLGARHERERAESIQSRCSHSLINLVGDLSLKEVEEQLRNVSLLVCADSALLQIANEVGTRSVCFSLSSGPHVNLYETGPTVPGSLAISQLKSIEDLVQATGMVLSCAINDPHPNSFRWIRAASDPLISLAVDSEPKTEMPSQLALERARISQTDPWLWNLRLYFKEPLTIALDPQERTKLFQMCDVWQAELDTLNSMLSVHEKVGRKEIHPDEAQSRLTTSLQLLEMLDSAAKQIASNSAGLSCLIRWKRTEKLRIGPGSQIQVIDAMAEICRQGLLFLTELGSEQAHPQRTEQIGSEAERTGGMA